MVCGRECLWSLVVAISSCVGTGMLWVGGVLMWDGWRDSVWMVRARRDAKKDFGEEGQSVEQHA